MTAVGGPGILDVQRAALAQTGPGVTPRPPAAVTGGPSLVQLLQQRLAEKEQPKPDEPLPIPMYSDMRTGIDLGARAEASLALTPKGRLNLLEQEYGKGNVFSRTPEAEPHNIFVRTWVPVSASEVDQLRSVMPIEAFDVDDNDQIIAHRWVQVDPQARRFGADIPGEAADVYADVLQGATGTAGATLGGVVGGYPGALVGAGVGEAIGSVTRQVAAEASGADEGLTLAERAARTGIDVAGSLAGEAIGPVIGKTVTELRPGNFLRRSLARGADEKVTEAGKKLAEQTGVKLSYAQLTGSQSAGMFERMLRQVVGVADYMLEQDVIRATQFAKAARATLDRYGGSISNEGAGSAVGSALDAHVQSLITARSKTGKKLFGKFDRLAGGDDILPVNNYIKALADLEDQAKSRMTGPADSAAIMVEKLKAMRGQLVGKPKRGEAGRLTGNVFSTRVSGADIKNAMSFLSGVIGGRESIAKDLSKANNRRMARKLIDAINLDLDDAAETLPRNKGARIADALRDARQAWAKQSEAIESAMTKPVERILDIADTQPDVIAQNFLKGRSDVEFRETLKLIDKVNPEAGEAVRASVLSQLFEQAPATGAFAERGLEFSPVRLANTLKKHGSRLDVVFDKKARQQLKAIEEVGFRIARTREGIGPGGAQTTPLRWMYDVLRNTTLAGALQPQHVLSQVATLFSARKLAEALTQAEGRQLLLETLRIRPETKYVTRLAQRLAWYNTVGDDTQGPVARPRKQKETPVERAMRFMPAAL